MLFVDYYHLEHNSKAISYLLKSIFKDNLIVCVKELRKLCTYVNAILIMILIGNKIQIKRMIYKPIYL